MPFEINQLGQLVQPLMEYFPPPVQEKIKADISGKMIWAGMSKFPGVLLMQVGKLSDILKRKGIAEEEILKKCETDENFFRLFVKILDSVKRELIESKLDAWAELIFKAYNGIKIENGLDTDKLIQLLADLSPRELLVLGEIYKNFNPQTQENDTIPASIPEHSPITIEELEPFQTKTAMSRDEINSILIRISSLGLITPIYDRTAYWANKEKTPIPATFDYQRNNYGLCFFLATLKLRNDLKETKK